jgi:hypothetical protein
MAHEKASAKNKEGAVEKGSRWLRNVNIIGGVACLGAAVLAPPLVATGLTAYGAFNLAQAGGYEAARRWAKNRGDKKKR